MEQYRYTISQDDQMESVSEAWSTFAEENSATDLGPARIVGRSLWDFITDAETRQLYEHLFARVREVQASVSVPFRCDAPAIRRFMRLTIAPAGSGSLELVVHVVAEEERQEVELLDVSIPRDSDLITMCSWCLRVLVAPDQWDEVEVAIERLRLFERRVLPGISHGVCPECFARVMSVGGGEAP